MKRFAFVLALFAVAAALVAVGRWLGLRERILTEAYSITTFDKHLTEASMKALILQRLDSGHLDDARQLLQSQLNGEILMVDSLIGDVDKRSRDLAQKVFARIASYQAEHPSSPTGNEPEWRSAINAKIADILRRAEAEQRE